MNIKRRGTYKMKGLLVFISLSVVYPGKITTHFWIHQFCY